ncbi:MAG: tetratricopeptide repeat protein [Cyanobacteria bacterium P01_H01_bin.121]
MIVKNEAERLPQCLASVRELADELIVLDTGSSDRTPELAESLGASVYHYPWQDDFATARNQSLTYATGDWILVLDADECLVPGITKPLRRAIQSPQQLVVNLVRREVGATQSPYSLVSRLFRRHPGIHFSRPYHALIDDSVLHVQAQESGWQVSNLTQVAILHAGYQQAAIAQQQKFERARRSMERYWQQHPNDAYVCAKLGALYFEQGEFQKSQQCLQQGLTHSSQAEADIRYELHYHAGLLYRRLGQLVAATQQYQQAIQQPILELLKFGSYINLGNLYLDQGKAAAAQQLYETVLTIDPDFSLGHYNLALSRKAQGDIQGAIAAYQTTLELDPEYANAHQNLGVLWLKQGQVAASVEAFRTAIRLHSQQGNETQAQALQAGLQDMGLQV